MKLPSPRVPTAPGDIRSAADALLWLAGLLPLALMAALLLVLVSLSPARAAGNAGDESCHGRNLLQEMRQSDPDLHARIAAEADGVANGRGLLWKIEKPGIEPSWLLGTMHVTDPRVLDMPPGAREAFAASDTVVIESDEILDEKKASASILMQPELSMFTDGRSIPDFLDAGDIAALEAGLKKRGLPLAAVSRMKPWMIASFVAIPACELARKAAGASYLDKKIAEDAVAAGKDVKGLETLAEQLGAMNDLPIEFHLQALIETLALADTLQDVMTTMTDLYLAGEIGMAMPMLQAVAPPQDDRDESAYAAFEKRIVTDRNRIMAERSAPILAKGKAFIAVGALHLPGEAGLVELLRGQGFTVTPAGG